MNLEYVMRTLNESERMDYIRRAREKFIDAIVIERSPDNRFMSYFSLAFCNKLLNDEQNMRQNLQQAYDVYKQVERASKEEVWIVVDEAVSYGSDGDEGIQKFGKAVLAVATLGLFPIIDKTQAVVQKYEINRAKEQLEIKKPFVPDIIFKYY